MSSAGHELDSIVLLQQPLMGLWFHLCQYLFLIILIFIINTYIQNLLRVFTWWCFICRSFTALEFHIFSSFSEGFLKNIIIILLSRPQIKFLISYISLRFHCIIYQSITLFLFSAFSLYFHSFIIVFQAFMPLSGFLLLTMDVCFQMMITLFSHIYFSGQSLGSTLPDFRLGHFVVLYSIIE